MSATVFNLLNAFTVIPFVVVNSQLCTIPLKKPEYTPVYILSENNVHTLFKPTGDDTQVSQSQLTLACTGAGNKLRSHDAVSITLQCKSGKWQYNQNDVKDLNTYRCNFTPESSLVKTGSKCAKDTGDIFKVGFDAGSGIFLEVFQICHRGNTKTGLYSYHVINGVIGKTATTKLREFCNDETFLPLNVKYNVKITQKKTFDRLLGAGQTYLDTGGTFYMAVGHHAPCADFTYEYEQVASNYLINAAPQYQGLNTGNWKVIEDRTRNKAWNLKDDLEVYTGSLDTLKLPKMAGGYADIYLDTNDPTVTVNVPKYFFKVVKYKNDAIALVGLNNIVPPEVAPELSKFCTNICDSEERFEITRKGLIICCELKDFMSNSLVEKVLPPLTATGILSGFY